MRTIYRKIYLFVGDTEKDLESITKRQCLEFNMVKIVVEDDIIHVGDIRMALETECHLNTVYKEIKIIGVLSDAVQVGLYDR